MRRLAVALLFAADPAWAVEAPRFVEESAAAGVVHRYVGGWEHYVGGGVAAFDCDADGRADLWFAGGAEPATLWRNRSSVGGALRFEKVEHAAADRAVGAYPLDVDDDGIMDLYVLRVGENHLLKGRGDCRFERADDVYGLDGGDDWSSAFSATWEAGRSGPTLAVGNYVDRDEPGAPFGTCHDNLLLRPEMDAGGRLRYSRPEILKPGHCALSMLFSDWNRDGTPDLRVSNDRQYYRGGEEQLFRLDRDKPARLYGRGEGWRKLTLWGMGIASYDLDGDSYPEYFLTSMTDNKLQRLAGRADRPEYEDVAQRLNATLHRPYAGGDVLPSTAWHAEFGDVNADGFVDLFVAKGNVEGMLDFARKDPNNLLLGAPKGPFREAAPDAGIMNFASARGAALVDLNLDGMLELVVVNRNANVEIWRSLGFAKADDASPVPMGNWIQVRLEQPAPNIHGVGAWVEVRAGSTVWRREVTVGGGHAGGQAGWVHFGIGAAERALVRVQWPDGSWGPFVRLPANQFAKIRRDDERPVVWLPPRESESDGETLR